MRKQKKLADEIRGATLTLVQPMNAKRYGEEKVQL
jgi:hypothetical protein